MGGVAEVGVFAGDFARYINEYFPADKLYLFDTFEGFQEQDILVEKRNGYSCASVGDYSLTSVEVVMKKMRYPENVIIRKGYFPDTAYGINETFKFVNLDLDLYLPTLKGLDFFKNRMIREGVILIHDYFNMTFNGVKMAVDKFMNDNPHLSLVPIGDTLSVMIMGFAR